MELDLKACPFCGRADVKIKQLESGGVAVVCLSLLEMKGCGAQGAVAGSREKAARAWNLRAETELESAFSWVMTSEDVVDMTPAQIKEELPKRFSKEAAKRVIKMIDHALQETKKRYNRKY